jgi:DNA polymerase
MSDPTRFDLDERQRAMLAEMGVRVWWPQVQASGPDASPQTAAVVASAASAEPAASVQAAAERPIAAPSAVMPTAASVSAAPASRLAPKAPSQPAASVVGQALAAGVDAMDWATLHDTVAACRACELCGQRQKPVFGVGDVQADWMVIGDPQAEAEGQQGEPFVGQASQLLDNMLKAVGLNRQAQGEGGVYITSSLKCRLPASRNPSPQELATCAPYLARQVVLVQPKVILVMGRFAVQSVLQSTEPLGKLRGKVHHYQGVPVVVTYHPDALLRNLADKAKAWADLLLALKVVRG